MEKLLAKLKEEFGNTSVLTGDGISERYRCDWSNENPVLPTAVLRPVSTDELSIILRHCYENGQKIVIQGGLTGLAGGATPQADEIAISLERMCTIEELDHESMTMTVQAGTPLQKVQQAATDAGFHFPLDLGARGSCTIGGNISTNAGGNQVIRYGMMRNQVLGLEAVLADGTVISSLNKMLKNNAGYDLKHLFIGTEGTLGIVTRAVLRLQPQYQSVCTALCALSSFSDVIRLLQKTGKELSGSVSSFEVMWSDYFQYIIENVEPVRSPFEQSYPVYVLLETEGSDKENDEERIMAVLGDAMETGILQDVVISQSRKDSDMFWAIRDGIGDVTPLLLPMANFDISIPISRMDAFLEFITGELRSKYAGIRILIFGHIGDGNLHILATTGSENDVKGFYEIVYSVMEDYQGSISAEHGIGVIKKGYLPYSRTLEEIDLMRTLKKAMDPKGILNPGRII